MATNRRGNANLRSIMDEGQARRRGRWQFVQEVYGELTKVTWPSREEAARLTGLVLVVAITMGIFLGAFDFAFSQAVEFLFF